MFGLMTDPVEIRQYIKREMNNNWRKIHGKPMYRYKQLQKPINERIRRSLKEREKILYEFFDDLYRNVGGSE